MRPYFLPLLKKSETRKIPRANPNFFTMMQNLRSVFAQVYRRGRSRNFSSTPGNINVSSWGPLRSIVKGIAAAAGGYAIGPFIYDVDADKKFVVENNQRRMRYYDELFEESEKFWSDYVARQKSEQTKRQ